MAKLVVGSLEEVKQLKGKTLGPTEWKVITHEQVNDFARATGDFQWIHTDPERAARESPFKKTIAHGYMSLALLGGMYFEMIEVQGVKMAVNYGTNKVRFPAPLPVGASVRMAAEVAEVETIEGGLQLTIKASLEVQGASKPAMVAEVLFRYY
ncbi:MAG: MaoC family dehydratase [Myxococcales bacterium]